MVASNIVPLDTISIKVVQYTETGLLVWRNFTSCSVIRLRKTSTASVRPVFALVKRYRGTLLIGPEHCSLCMINNTARPEIPLGVLGNQSVELILFCGWVKGHRLHTHGFTISSSISLLEGGAAKLPGNNVASIDSIPRISPEMVWSMSITQVGSTSNNLLLRGTHRLSQWSWLYNLRLRSKLRSRRGYGLRLKLLNLGLLKLLLWLELLLRLRLELLLLGLESRGSWLLKLLLSWSSRRWRWTAVTVVVCAKQVVEGPWDTREEPSLLLGQGRTYGKKTQTYQ
jgi:hypothetical protein